MTNLLEEAILLWRGFANARLKTLPPNEQDAIAAMILSEIEDEKRWDAAFAKSENVLAQLASEAIADIAQAKLKN